MNTLTVLLEESVEIAWVYLQRTGEIKNATMATDYLTKLVADSMRKGERSRLRLANAAIDAYKRHTADEIIQLVR